MPIKHKTDRRFHLTSLFGVVTLAAVSFGLLNIGVGREGELFEEPIIVGAFLLAAVAGAVVGLAVGGRNCIIIGGVVGVYLLIFGGLWLLWPTAVMRVMMCGGSLAMFMLGIACVRATCDWPSVQSL